MTRLGLRPYTSGDGPPPRSVPVSVVVLAYNEEVNIRRCLASLAWAEQVVVIDSGSTDATVPIARGFAATVVEQEWLGFAGQRDFALRHPAIRHDWVLFVDADMWVSPALASEVAERIGAPLYAAFAQRLRLVFDGSWIRHCGWYAGSWTVTLMDRRRTAWDGRGVGERACVDGPIGRLVNDAVDEDHKGLARWLQKHIQYAQIEALERKQRPVRLWERLRQARSPNRPNGLPLIRAVARDVIFPAIPGKPLAIFLYMYVLRLGLLDGRAGLRFCLYHAWYELVVAGLRMEELAGTLADATHFPLNSRPACTPDVGRPS